MIREPRPLKLALRWLVIGYLILLVLWPVSLVVTNTFADGLTNLKTAFTSPAVLSALRLTAKVTIWAVVLNLVFGVGVSLLLVRYDFWGKRVLSTLVDLPLSVSPVVVGLALMLVYRRDSAIGGALYDLGYQIIFATPGIIAATVFVALPLVIREVVPVLIEVGDDQEQAARSLGGSGWQVFWRVTLPSIRWAVVYGVVLALARRPGRVRRRQGGFGVARCAPRPPRSPAVEETYANFQQGTAYAVAFLLTVAAVACITAVSLLRPREDAS